MKPGGLCTPWSTTSCPGTERCPHLHQEDSHPHGYPDCPYQVKTFRLAGWMNKSLFYDSRLS